MKARICGRAVEIDGNRVRGGVERHAEPYGVMLGTYGTTQPKHRAGAIPAPAPTYRSHWEARYAQHLEILKRASEIVGYWYEPIRFRLPGKRNFYKPDFLVCYPPVLFTTKASGLEYPASRRLAIHEVKGWSKNRREGITKLKTAAGLNPWIVFKLVRWDRARSQWIEQIVT